jgi:hypothetical protein
MQMCRYQLLRHSPKPSHQQLFLLRLQCLLLFLLCRQIQMLP